MLRLVIVLIRAYQSGAYENRSRLRRIGVIGTPFGLGYTGLKMPAILKDACCGAGVCILL